MFLILLCHLIFSAPVVSDTDILMTKQTYGECRRDLSVDGKKLTIGGTVYNSGIGTHATSMIPITVPKGAKSLTGACGIDDEITNDASVLFQISSGSEVLFTALKKRNEPATTFSVPVPAGATILYLLAGEIDTTKNIFGDEPANNNANDHSDWVNLQWNYNQSPEIDQTKLPPEYYPSTNENDYGPAIRKLIAIARSDPGSTILIPKGDYHFYAAGALKLSFHVSNHDQPTFQPVAIPLLDLHNVTIDCQGSTFYFHNLIHPIVILDSQNVTVKNVKIDYSRPYYTQAIIKEIGFFSTTIYINKTLYPYHIESGKFVFDHENFTLSQQGVTLFNGTTKHIIPGSSNASITGVVAENEDGTCSIAQNFGTYGAVAGDAIVFSSYLRPYPAVTIYRSLGTTLDGVYVASSEGMAVLSQRSEDIHITNSGAIYSDESRYTSAHCDAVHFSNNRGHILVENSRFEGMLDDSINVHSTSLQITSISGSTIEVQYMHSQSVGFETVLPNEHIQFIKASTLELSEIRAVAAVRKMSTTKLQITINGSIPSGIAVGDAIENSDYYPSVTFRNNTVSNNKARGSLFTTPKQVIVEDNLFDYPSGSAILLAGDAANWFESGASRNVIIRRNKLINPLTARYQFTNGIFSFCPSISNVAGQKAFYHTNIRIEDNYIETSDVPLFYALSAANVEFKNNQIVYNNDCPSWKQKPFIFNKVSNITITGNTVTPSKTFSIDDVSLTNTDQAEIHFK